MQNLAEPEAEEHRSRGEGSPSPQGRVVTFYSYKGGVGRSMALANVAWILASAEKRVLVIDWDLEAPGLHRYLAPFLQDAELRTSPGLIDHFLSYVGEVSGYGSERSEETQESLDATVEEYSFLTDIQVPVQWDLFDKPGRIDFVGAGQQMPGYAECVNLFDWRRFYQELGGRKLVLNIFANLRKQYDWVLIDSRTGVSDTSGICTVELPDDLVLCYTLNNQNIKGAESILRVASKAREASDFRMFPVETRLDPFELGAKERRQNHARRLVMPFMTHIPSNRREAYFEEVGVQYIPWYGYEEQLSVFKDSPHDPKLMLASYVRLAQYLGGPDIQAPIIDREVAERVIGQFSRLSYTSELAPHEIVEQHLSGLPDEQSIQAMWLILGLIRVSSSQTPSEATMSSTSVSDLPHRELLKELEQVGFLQVSSADDNAEEIVVPSFSSIAKDWPRLREWIETHRPFLLLQQQLRDFAEQYAIAQPKPDPSVYASAMPGSALELLSRHSEHLGRKSQALLEEIVKTPDERAEERWYQLPPSSREAAIPCLASLVRISGAQQTPVLMPCPLDDVAHARELIHLKQVGFVSEDTDSNEVRPHSSSLAVDWMRLHRWIEDHKDFIMARQQLQELIVQRATLTESAFLRRYGSALSKEAYKVLDDNEAHLGGKSIRMLHLMRARKVHALVWSVAPIVLAAVSLAALIFSVGQNTGISSGQIGSRDPLPTTTAGTSTGSIGNQEDPDLVELQGQVAFDDGDYKAAVERFERLASLRPNYAEGRLRLADAYIQAGDLKSAREQCRVLVAGLGDERDLYPRIVDTLFAIYIRTSDKDTVIMARDLTKRALLTDNQSQTLLFQAAWSAKVLGDDKSARLYKAQAISRVPKKRHTIYAHAIDVKSYTNIELPLYAMLSARDFAIEAAYPASQGIPGIRYYFDEDKGAADEVARTTNDLLRSLGFVEGVQAIKPPRKSPRVEQGTVALWMPRLTKATGMQ